MSPSPGLDAFEQELGIVEFALVQSHPGGFDQQFGGNLPGGGVSVLAPGLALGPPPETAQSASGQTVLSSGP